MNKIKKIIANMSNQRQWFVLNKEAKVPEILIYDQIGSDFWDEGLTPKDFINEFRSIEEEFSEVNIRINSPGGNIHDGFAIYNHIMQSSIKTNVYIDGIAASAASFIAMAADVIYMPPTAEIMIHDPWSIVIGNSDDLRDQADRLDSLQSIIVSVYSKRTGLSNSQISEMSKKETWIDGIEAVETGFADELLETAKVAACVFDLDPDILPGLPEKFINLQKSLKKRSYEKDLREAGISRAKAKMAVKQRDAVKNRAKITDQEVKMPKENQALNSDENKDEPIVVEPGTPAALENPQPELTPANPKPENPQIVPQEAKPIDRAELQSLSNEFGAEIAVKVALSGGGKAEAYKLKAEAAENKLKALESENEKLKKQKAPVGGNPAEFSDETKTKKTAWGN
ncbi:MAG: ATP-dependent Clp protease proteolytic subunit [Victivallaceae bacterium]|nr:ATP-dependent Clp protease proteolytic subunit [Victivallaceae bacterium]